MEEVFGHDDALLGAGERFCTEPIVPGACYTKIVHAVARELPGGDFACDGSQFDHLFDDGETLNIARHLLRH